MKISKVIAGISTFGSSLYLASAVAAQSSLSTSPTDLITGITSTGETDLMAFIKKLLNYAIGLAALVCVVILIFAGYRYITASGDEAKIQSATKTLTWAIVGLVVCFIAVILVQFVLTELLSPTA